MSISVKELLEHKELELTLVSGHEGIENQIFLSNVTDSDEVHKWLVGGECILSNGFVFDGHPEKIATMVRDLAEVGAVCLIVKTGRYVKSIPKEAVDVSNELGFPLIEAKQRLKFSEINKLINQSADQLPDSAERYNAFVELLSRNAGAASFLWLLSKYIGRDTAYYDNTNCNTVTSRVDFLVPDYGTTDAEKFFDKNTVHVVRSGDLTLGKLVIRGQEEFDNPELAQLTIGYTLSMLGITQQRSLPSRFRDEYWLENFISELLHGSSLVSDDEIDRRGRLCGYDFFQPTILAIISPQDHSSRTAREIYKTVIESGFLPKGALLVQLDNTLALFWGGGLRKVSQFRKLCNEISACADKQGYKVIVGISTICSSPHTLDRAYSEATKALEMGARAGGPGVYYIKDLVAQIFLYKYAETIEAENVVQVILGKLLEHDREKPNYALMPTLEALIKCGFNLTRTAEELIIHYNTLKYRVQKICEIINLNLDEYDTQEKVHLAVTLHHLRQSEIDID